MDKETWQALLTCAQTCALDSDSDEITQAGLDAEKWLMKPENSWAD